MLACKALAQSRSLFFILYEFNSFFCMLLTLPYMDNSFDDPNIYLNVSVYKTSFIENF